MAFVDVGGEVGSDGMTGPSADESRPVGLDGRAVPVDLPAVHGPIPATLAVFFVLGLALALNWVTLRGLFQDSRLIAAHDVRGLVINTVEFTRCFQDGVWWPEWLPDLSGGYGGPNPLYYSPLTFHLTGRLHQAGLSVKTSLKLVAALAMVISFVGMFLWGSRVWLWPGGLLAATLYLYAPYHLTDLYVRLALSELLGMALAPWLFLAVSLQREDRWSSAWKLLGIGLALLVMVHNVSVVLFLGLLVGYSLCLAVQDGNARGLGLTFKAIVLGFSLTAFFWIPALAEQDYTGIPQDISLKLSWKYHILATGRLWDSHWPGTRANIPLYLGHLHILLGGLSIVTAVILLRLCPRFAAVHLGFAAVTGAHLFLALDLSKEVWAHTPLPAVQFPWRFLAPAALGLSFLIPLSLYPLSSRPRLLAFASVVISCLAAFYYSSLCFNKTGDPLVWTPDSLVRATETGDFENKYLPVGAQEPMEPGPTRFRISAGTGSLTVLETTSEFHRLSVDARETLFIDIRIYEFPGWEAMLDGERVEMEREEGIGGMRVVVKPGQHQLEVRFRTTPLRWWTRFASIGVVLALILSSIRLPVPNWIAFFPLGLGIAGALLAFHDRWIDRFARRAVVAERLQLNEDTRRALERASRVGPRSAWARERLKLRDHSGLLAFQHGDVNWRTLSLVQRVHLLSFDTRCQLGYPPFFGPFSTLLTGRLFLPSTGVTSFALESDDGSSLYLDQKKVVENEGRHAPLRREGSIWLEEGSHELVILHRNDAGDATLRVYWKVPGGPWKIIPTSRCTPARFDWTEKILAAERSP